MSEEQDKLKVSLEPPKLFGRKKKSDAKAEEPATPASEPTSKRRGTQAASKPVETPAPETAEPAEGGEPAIEIAAADSPTEVIEPAAQAEAAAEPAATTAPPAAAKKAPAKQAAAKKTTAEKAPAKKTAAKKAPAKKTAAKKAPARRPVPPAEGPASPPAAAAPDATVTRPTTDTPPAATPPSTPTPAAEAETETPASEATATEQTAASTLAQPAAPAKAPAPEKPAPAAKEAPAARKPEPVTSAAEAEPTTPSGESPPAPAAGASAPGAARSAPGKLAAAARKAVRRQPGPEIEPEPVSSADLEDAEIAAVEDVDEEPILDLYPAAAVTGAIVGAAMVLLTFLSLRGCEAVRGTASCGNGPGFLLLLATFAICVLLGTTLLRTFLVPDPGSSSFLAVGVVAVVALLVLIDVLMSWPMIIVIPLLSVGAYLGSVWITKTFVETADT